MDIHLNFFMVVTLKKSSNAYVDVLIMINGYVDTYPSCCFLCGSNYTRE
jgi:hypothetical protein